MEGIKVNGESINNIRYANDAVLIADSESKLQDMDKTMTESEKLGLSLSVKKTYCMVISKKERDSKVPVNSEWESDKASKAV